MWSKPIYPNEPDETVCPISTGSICCEFVADLVLDPTAGMGLFRTVLDWEDSAVWGQKKSGGLDLGHRGFALVSKITGLGLNV